MSIFVLVQVRSVSVVTRAVVLTDLVVRAPKVQEVRQLSPPSALPSAGRSGQAAVQLHAATHAQSSVTGTFCIGIAQRLAGCLPRTMQKCRVCFRASTHLC